VRVVRNSNFRGHTTVVVKLLLKKRVNLLYISYISEKLFFFDSIRD
jgi:hypothetical protein